jgi:hypothetical protein
MRAETQQLQELVRILGGQTASATRLGVSQGSISRWLGEKVVMNGSARKLLTNIIPVDKLHKEQEREQNAYTNT